MDKSIVLTGASSGIGYQTALQLAAQKHHLVLVSRSIEKGDRTRNQVREQIPDARIDLVTADLALQKHIRRAGEEINQLTPKIDVLINNAGTWNSHRIITDEGIEEVFAVNHLSYFLLTHLLYTSLVNSESARIINVSSDSHFKGRIHLDDLGLKNNYHGLRSYAQSKLANVHFTYELHRRKPHLNIVVNAVQPGLVTTDIGLKNTNWWHALAWKIRRSAGVSASEGAKTSVYLATAPDIAEVSAKYWENCQVKPSSKRSYNLEDARRLWEYSEQMCGITDYFSVE
jgi:NAD(P)-dependent dehydrogenase (short-subunit alcohol dehydrogenase family)